MASIEGGKRFLTFSKSHLYASDPLALKCVGNYRPRRTVFMHWMSSSDRYRGFHSQNSQTSRFCHFELIFEKSGSESNFGKNVSASLLGGPDPNISTRRSKLNVRWKTLIPKDNFNSLGFAPGGLQTNLRPKAKRTRFLQNSTRIRIFRKS